MKTAGRQSLPESPRWTKSLLELPVLSIRQPYAWLVVNGIKDIENRSKRTRKRQRILIHASSSRQELTPKVLEWCQARTDRKLPAIDDFETGGIVGIVEITDCVRRHSSPWKSPSNYGWVLANAQPLKFRACKGFVTFFYPDWK